jgi:hypothetical protein
MNWIDEFIKTIPTESKFSQEVWLKKHDGQVFAITVEKSETGWKVIKVS